ncbi:MAG: DUF2283 domain-containing protein [Anaerolineae bacterium]|nr:DUF2283 domain-containing protein [Anaerolineae bacterium]
MTNPTIRYDEASDTLTVSFASGASATGLELNEHILLRVNKAERQAISLTFLDYSLLIQPDELGVRQFPLTGLNQLADETKAIVLDVLKREPVRDYLSLSVYTPTFANTIPIVSVKAVLATA